MVFFLHKFTFLYYLFVVILAFLITTIVIPSILHVARFRHLYDDLGHFRKKHDHGIPRLGGVAIFVGFTITLLLCCMTDNSLPMNYLISACILLFAMGLKDDLSGVNSMTKLSIQFIVCIVLVCLGNIRLTTFYGAFGVYELPYAVSVAFSILFIVLVVNAFNLIDGIDGLAATTGIMVNCAFGAMFIYLHQYELAAVSFVMSGAIAGFLRFNVTPAKIFMGDTGSLLIGLISVVMAIKFLEVNRQAVGMRPVLSAPAVTLAILSGPIFDTVRIFIVRIASGVSPFNADRNHIHHRVLRLGFTHIQSTIVLTLLNIACILLVFLLNNYGYGDTFLISLIVFISLMMNWMITFFIRSKERESLNFKNLFI
jgi:UDP-GlcNAc:undecaprenyl-phosphate/decaprenyl-phosphate GlcNAc-1-phosphate transferase